MMNVPLRWVRASVGVSDVLLLSGIGLTLYGVARWSVPLACILGGVVLVLVAFAADHSP